VTLPPWSAPIAGLIAALVVVGWNVAQGARLSVLPSAGPALRVLAGLSAFLLLPALAVALLSTTAPGARILGPLDWIWPATTICVLLAGTLTVARDRLTAASLIVLLFNALAAWIAVARWLQGAGMTLAPWAVSPVTAASTLAATVFGEAVFPWGAVLVIPALVPAKPGRGRASSVAWVTVTLCVAVLTTGVLAGLPRAHALLLAAERLALPAPAGAREPLAIGLRLFGALSSAPSGTVARRDIALADSLGVTAVHVALMRQDISNAALDSIARTLEPRRDSITLIVTLQLHTALPPPESVAERERLQALERIARRLRPDVLVPADRVAPDGAPASVQDIARHYELVAKQLRRINRRLVIALGTEAAEPADSMAVEWLMQGETPVAAIALAVRGEGADPQRFVDALAAISRWASLGRPSPDTWLLGVPTAPTVTGERVQRQLVRYALAWATARPWVRGVIAGDASDVSGAVALRTAGGRRRGALTDVASALRLQRDATLGSAAAATPAPSPADSTARPSNPPPP
jgi:hypothetical protein